MRILIVRHAEPDYAHNTLTEKGFKEAELLAERMKKIKIDDLYSSPQGRAVKTAEVSAEKIHKEFKVLDWLTEFEGKIIDDEEKRIPWNLLPQFWTDRNKLYNIYTWLEDSVMSCDNVSKCQSMVNNGFDNLLGYYGYQRKGIIYECEENIDKTIVLFCHFGLGMLLVSRLTGISPVLLWQTMFMPTSSVTTFVTEEREKGEVVFKCMQLGDTSHLYAADEPISKSGLYAEFFGGEGCGPLV